MNSHIPFDVKSCLTPEPCQNTSNDPLVDKLIGNSYHVVRTVYCNLDDIKFVYDFLSRYNVIVAVKSEKELKALPPSVLFTRVYTQYPSGRTQYADYLYVEGDISGILPDDPSATGSWIPASTLSNGGEAYIPWLYNGGSANGGESKIIIDEPTIGVPEIFINGLRKQLGIGYTFDSSTNTLTLTEPLKPGDELVAKLSGMPALPDNGTVDGWKFVNWIYNKGNATGGETVLSPPYVFITVPAIFVNGLRKVESIDYTVDNVAFTVTLNTALTAGDVVVVQLGGEANTLFDKFGSPDGASTIGTLTGNTVQEELDGIKVSSDVTNKNTRAIWNRLCAEIGLTLVAGSFQDGATLTKATDALWDVVNGKIYTWSGAFPHTVVAGTNPVADANWVPQTDSNIRGDLANTSNVSLGDAMIGVKFPLPGAVSRTQHQLNAEYLSIDDFGAVGNAFMPDGTLNPSPTDDSAAIQAAIKASWLAGGVKIVATSGKGYYVASRVYTLAQEGTPRQATNYPLRRIQIFDFQGATFIGKNSLADATNVFMEAGFIDTDGVIKSVFGTASEQYLTSGVAIRNANLKSFRIGFRLRGFVFGCVIEDIVTNDVAQVIYTERSFYTSVKRITPNGNFVDGLPRYHFKDNNNIMPMEAVHTGVCDYGFKFEGATEAINMVNCGVESFQTVGVLINGGFNIKFDSCYFESDRGYGVLAAGAIPRITMDNCWVYGGCTAFGGFDDNTSVYLTPNNILGGGSVWWKLNEGSEYNLSDINWPTIIVAGNTKLPLAVAKAASTVTQTVVYYDPAVGVPSVVAKAEQTSGFHKIRVNGATSGGSTGHPFTAGSVTSVVDGVGVGSSRVIWSTGIIYTDYQFVRIALSVSHLNGTWLWRGYLDGNVLHKSNVDANADITVTNDNGYLVVSSPDLPKGTGVTVLAGEIRIL